MDPLHLCIAIGPLAAYLVMLGLVNLSRRPRTASGTLDRIGLGIALSGLVIVGPIELFLPQAAADHYGPFVWFLLLGSYSLCVTLWLLTARPRLVVYNAPADQVRPVLETVVARLDSDARWAGDSLLLPQLGVQLHLEYYPALRNLSLVAIGERQSYTGWQRLHRELAAALRQVEVRPSMAGAMLLLAGLAGIALPVASAMLHRQAVAEKFWELLKL
jgi:hypothetical protein